MLMYDIVICVSGTHRAISLKAIRSVVCFSQARNIFIITSSKNFFFFQKIINSTASLFLINEDELIEGNIDLNFVQKIFQKRTRSKQRSGWYFQQFLKMAICNLPGIAKHYLIWDSDTLMLRRIQFFDKNGKIFINPQVESHKPYFTLIENILGIQKQVDFSFISEHMMIRTSYMRELIDTLKSRAPTNRSWVEFILNSINDKDLSASGFSEYEIYGNFITNKHKESYVCRTIKSTRYGTTFCGNNPSKYDIFGLMKVGYFFVTFESWHFAPRRKIMKIKCKYMLSYVFNSLMGKCREQLKAASVIGRNHNS